MTPDIAANGSGLGENARNGGSVESSPAVETSVQSEPLPPCPFCGDKLYVSRGDIDGWIACVACDGCDMRGPMSEWKYADPAEAEEDGVRRWRKGAMIEAAPAPPTDDETVAQIVASEPDKGYSDGGLVFTYGQAERMVRKALAMKAP